MIIERYFLSVSIKIYIVDAELLEKQHLGKVPLMSTHVLIKYCECSISNE